MSNKTEGIQGPFNIENDSIESFNNSKISSPENKTSLLFNSKEDLIQVLHKYRKIVYNDIEIDEETIDHFVKYFRVLR